MGLGVGFLVAVALAVGSMWEGGLYGRVRGGNVRAYLESGRRLGIYRHYAELDAEEEK